MRPTTFIAFTQEWTQGQSKAVLAADKGDSQLLTSTTTVDYNLFVATYGLVYFFNNH